MSISIARPRKPTEALQLSGAFRKDPQRARPVGAKPSKGLGCPPAYFTEAEALVWREIEGNVAPGVLTSADRYVLELLSRLVAKFRESWLTAAQMSQMTWCFSHLGITPADRSKVEAPETDAVASPLDEFLN